MKGARISIVTVVRNGAETLEGTILSVLEMKSRAEIDYIVIDGGSTDGTLDIVGRYADRIAYFVSEPDLGTYHAMNKGWAAADEGSSVLFLGAGDRILSLPAGMDRYCRGEVVFGTVRMGDGRIFIPRADWHLNLYNTLHHQALLVPKALHPAPPFDLRYPVYADFDFNQRLARSGARFVFCADFSGYALPGGVSDGGKIGESLAVVRQNCGFAWAFLALSGYYAMKFFPGLRRLRPIKAA